MHVIPSVIQVIESGRETSAVADSCSIEFIQDELSSHKFLQKGYFVTFAAPMHGDWEQQAQNIQVDSHTITISTLPHLRSFHQLDDHCTLLLHRMA